MGDLMLLLILGSGIWLAIALGKSANKRQQARRQLALARWQHAVQTLCDLRTVPARPRHSLPSDIRAAERRRVSGGRVNEQQDAWFEDQFPPCRDVIAL
jgi:hypothetical protein